MKQKNLVDVETIAGVVSFSPKDEQLYKIHWSNGKTGRLIKLKDSTWELSPTGCWGYSISCQAYDDVICCIEELEEFSMGTP